MSKRISPNINGSTVNFQKSIRILGLLTWLMFAVALRTHAQKNATVLLAGYNQIPPVTTSGTGSVTVTLRDDTLNVEGSFSELSSVYYGGYIHYGNKDERGNQLIRLEPDLNEDQTGGSFDPEKNQWVLNDSQLKALANGRLYINIYSYDHQTGELRGQIPPMK